jgi:hypothetical protein
MQETPGRPIGGPIWIIRNAARVDRRQHPKQGAEILGIGPE